MLIIAAAVAQSSVAPLRVAPLSIVDMLPAWGGFAHSVSNYVRMVHDSAADMTFTPLFRAALNIALALISGRA